MAKNDFRISNAGVLEKYNGYDAKVIVPNGVKEIGCSAFAKNQDIKSVKLPSSVSKIGASAFSGCKSLVSVTIQNGLTEIGDHSFVDCVSLKKIKLPNSLTTILNGAFENCKILKLKIPKSVSQLGTICILDFVYNNAKQHVYLPGNPFDSRDWAKRVKIDPANGHYKVKANAIYSCNGEILACYLGDGKETVFNIPEGVKGIGANAFLYNESLTKIIIPASILCIGDFGLLTFGKTSLYFRGGRDILTGKGSINSDDIVYNYTGK